MSTANLSKPFIERPVATALLMVALFLSGLLGFRTMPVSALPDVDYPTIEVTTLYPGASPEVMGLTVTAPLERQFGQMSGLARQESKSAAGASTITLQFDLDVSLDVAEQEVQAAINAANPLLPSDLPAPPAYAKVNPGDAPIISLALTSRTRPVSELQRIADASLSGKLAQVPGVGFVSLSGGQRPALRISADARALAAANLSLETIRGAVAAANVNGAKGSLDGPARSWTIDANDQLLSPDDYRALILAWKNGAPIRLGDVATVAFAGENDRLGSWVNGQPAVLLDVRRQPGANVVATVDAIRAELPDLIRALPADVQLRVLADRTVGIRASVRDVQMELALAILLVTLAIFLFLGSLRATLIASVSVPLSLIGSFGVLSLLGYSVNNLTLMAMTIASGFVVDDAIVVIENIARHLEQGKSRREAALAGAREIGFTILSLTISLVAVLIPLLFMGDVVGRLFRQFAVTLATTILISAAVALTLIPMLAARWLETEQSASRVARAFRHGFEQVARRYRIVLTRALQHATVVLGVFIATLFATGLLFWSIPKGLFPEQDSGELQATIIAPADISFAAMSLLQARIASALLADPAIDNLSTSLGVDGANPAVARGRMLIALKPKSERPSLAEVLAALEARVARQPGAQVIFRPVEDLTIDTDDGPTRFRLVLQGADQAETTSWAARLARAMAADSSFESVVLEALDGPSLAIRLDRATAARLGVGAAAVDSLLYDAFGQRIVSTIFTPSNQYRVILEARRPQDIGPQIVESLYVPTASGAPVPLATMVRVEEAQTPLLIARVGQFPATTIGFEPAGVVSIDQAVRVIRRIATRLDLPSSLTLQFTGAAAAFQQSSGSELLLVIAALVIVYIVLGVLYESFIHPLTILSTLPSAGLGALVALWLSAGELGVIGIIGIVLLIGIVKKNGIMMVDFALADMRAGAAPFEAIVNAAQLRFRPIMMTTLAALVAALPLIFGTGMGAELRRPLGFAIAGGLIVSQALTLFTTPAIFLFFENIGRRMRPTRPPVAAT